MKKKKKLSVVITLGIILIVITMMNTLLVFRMTSGQTKQSGIYQLENISGELENNISKAKILTQNLGVRAMQYLDNREALEYFIVENKKLLQNEDNNGCYNLYIAGTGWDIIPDLDKPEGFVATERSWYQGAIKAAGEPYVTAPYVDAWTGNICYSVAVELGDGDTVIAVDYTLESMQTYISQLKEIGSQDAMIITEDGTIAGYADESLVGTNINESLPDYTAIFTLAKNSDGVVTGKLQHGFFEDNLFATRSNSGWYLIVSENNWEMYKDSYIQFFGAMGLSIILFLIIIALYLTSRRNQEKAEKALAAKEEFLNNISAELRLPLRKIVEGTRKENLLMSENFEEDMAKIQSASNQLSEMIEQIISYSAIVKKEKKEHKQGQKKKIYTGVRSAYRLLVILIIILVMLLSLYTNVTATYRYGITTIQKQVNNYEDQLSEWVNTQKSILDMFCSLISTNPELVEDYEGCVEYLNEITQQYPEISVTYMTNPEYEHTVIMNNGWEPDEDWHVEERQWYIDTMASEEGWSISTPYYDEQTGLYCVTISESVYNAYTGEFMGNFGIDFYMDKLVDILGASYSSDSYAFLVDADGEIVNHPYGTYQMSEEQISNVSDLSYAEVLKDGKSISVLRDYDGKYKVVIAKENSNSHFTVYMVADIWSIFGSLVIFSLLQIIGFIACIVAVYKLMTKMLRWQEQVNESLKQSADLAIQAGNAKSQFLAQMSHEIRTPINAVLGMNEMILREADDADIRDYALNIQSAGRTLLSLINSILDFSKIEDGKMEIIPVEYDAASLVHDLVNTIAERAAKKNLKLEVKADKNIPSTLFGDDVRVRQVVANLLTNAVKYTEKGTVTLSFQMKEKTDDQVTLAVSVKDTGIGIREEDREKLFESFQRLEEKRNRNIEGTGLGISIVTKLLNMMGSKLLVDSVYGEGSDFHFELVQGIVNKEPMGNYESRYMANANQTKQEEKVVYVKGGNILIVDDNEMNLKVACSLLKRNNVFPDVATSGEDAIRLVQNKDYDLIFLDHMMPKMDGIETLQKMRAENLLPEKTKVVALTANAIVGAKENYLKAGFDDYLTKPIEVAQMEMRLAKYLPAEFIEYRDGKKKGNGAAAGAGNGAGKGAVSDNVDAGIGNNVGASIGNNTGSDSGNIATAGAGNIATESEEREDFFRLEELITLRDQCPDINILSGMTYCGDSKEFYLSMAEEFVSSEKSAEIRQAYTEENWKDYATYVHALKSTAKTLGAVALSEHAKELELAAKAGQIEIIHQKQEALMQEYEAILEEFRKLSAF